MQVGIAFGYNATDYTFTLTDVTQYVRSVSITRGKTDDFQDFSSGQATIVLDNRDRRFDPSYSAGPYFGQLWPRTRIVVKVTTNNAQTVTLFNGFIGGWPQTYDDYGKDSTVQLPCYDLLALVSQIDLPTDPSKAMVLTFSDAYTTYYRFGDFTQQGDAVYDSTGNQRPMFVNGGPPVTAPAGTSLIGPELAPELNGTSSLFAGTLFGAGRYTYTNRSASLAASELNAVFGGWLQLPSTIFDYTGTGIGIIRAGDFLLGTNASGQLIVSSFDTGSVFATSSTNLSDDSPHHIMIRYDKATNLVRIYVDGEENTGSNANVGAADWYDEIYFYSAFTEFYAQDWVFWFNESSEVVSDWDAYAPDPLFARIFYGAGSNQAEMSTYFRFILVNALSGFPAANWAVLDNEAEYIGTCLEFNLSGKTMLQALQDVARTEQGFFFCDRLGRLRFMHRYKIAESILGITQMAFTDNPTLFPTSRTDPQGNVYCGYQDFGYDFDDAQLANSTQVVIGSGDSSSYDDSSSVAFLGKKSYSIDTLLGTTVAAQDMAEGLTNIYKDPIFRLRELKVKCTNDYTAYWLADMDIGDLIITGRKPQGIGSTITDYLTVLQVRHELTPQSWEMGIYASARPVNSFFILDHSELDGSDILGF